MPICSLPSPPQLKRAADRAPRDSALQAAYYAALQEQTSRHVVDRAAQLKHGAASPLVSAQVDLQKRLLLRGGGGMGGGGGGMGGGVAGMGGDGGGGGGVRGMFGEFGLGSARTTAGGAAAEAGGKEAPLYVKVLESDQQGGFFRSSVLPLVRTLAIGGFMLTAVLLLLDELKGMMPKQAFQTDKKIEPQTSDRRFGDVKGVDEAREELEEIVGYLKNPEKYTKLGGRFPKGVLLVGPPGTGKTLLARAIAGEAGVPFFYCSGSEFEEVFVGVGARRVRDLFNEAKKTQPCLIFIDEIDAIGTARSPKDPSNAKMTLNQLLVEMDGFLENRGIIVIAATNFSETLDPALVRPGRFDRHITVPLPDVRGREEILKHYLSKSAVAADVSANTLARSTPGMSGADLANLVNTAAIRAAQLGSEHISMASLDFAKDKILMGPEQKSKVMSQESIALTAFHESGHALVAIYTDGADPVYKATVMPRGRALGMVVQLPDQDQDSWTKKQMLARMDVCMGGRVAEEMIFGDDDVTSGASSDLQQATKIAHRMVTQFGMSDKVGKVFVGDETSGATKGTIDAEVRRLTDESYARARALLAKHKDDLHTLAKHLIRYETLSGEEINTVLKGGKLKRAEGGASKGGAKAAVDGDVAVLNQ